MDRRGFLRMLGLGAAAAAAPAKTYAFFGGILRPRAVSDEEIRRQYLKAIERIINPPIVVSDVGAIMRNAGRIHWETIQQTYAEMIGARKELLR